MENPAYNPEEGQRMANECLAARLLSGKDNTGGRGGPGTAVSTIYDPRAYGTTAAAAATNAAAVVTTPTPAAFQPTTRQQPGKRCTCWQPPSDIPHLHKCNSPPRTMCHTNMFVLYTFLFFTAIICLTTSVLLYITRIQGNTHRHYRQLCTSTSECAHIILLCMIIILCIGRIHEMNYKVYKNFVSTFIFKNPFKLHIWVIHNHLEIPPRLSNLIFVISGLQTILNHCNYIIDLKLCKNNKLLFRYYSQGQVLGKLCIPRQ